MAVVYYIVSDLMYKLCVSGVDLYCQAVENAVDCKYKRMEIKYDKNRIEKSKQRGVYFPFLSLLVLYHGFCI